MITKNIRCQWFPKYPSKVEILLRRGQVEKVTCAYLDDLRCASPNRREGRDRCYMYSSEARLLLEIVESIY